MSISNSDASEIVDGLRAVAVGGKLSLLEVVRVIDQQCEYPFLEKELEIEMANAGYGSLPGAAEDERTSMAARAKVSAADCLGMGGTTKL
jgi:hypothetical protein